MSRAARLGATQLGLIAGHSGRPGTATADAHVADAVLYMAKLPLDANVQFMTVMATAMPYIGRG